MSLSLQKMPQSVDLKDAVLTLVDGGSVNKNAADKTPSLFGVTKSFHQDVLADIYQNNISMVIWQRSLGVIAEYAQSLLTLNPTLTVKLQGDSDHMAVLLRRLLPDASGKDEFIDDVSVLVEMFACLFDLDEVGLRLGVLSNAMCPRFHVDKIPCRLVTTYAGAGSEWLHDTHVVRDKLGRGGHVNDHNSGLHEKGRINQLTVGDVALMKGDTWPTSLGRGVVHRSPSASMEHKRLFLSLDMI
ncbi:DUF1826 domain-containing protein [Marinomonas shanghaiensis]|uniref:DUF1826 domain-containing protein n=1 Tax=Marinomonas shanghaiensis TaxID=2202418 RepID=UPI001E4D5F6D|nr:DUF1826 domain-containing protein [Marinomonas shanghaiensis]